MSVTMPMILDVLAPFSPALASQGRTWPVFDGVRLFSASSSQYQSTTLYVATQQEIERFFTTRTLERMPDIYAVCIANPTWAEQIGDDIALILIPETFQFYSLFNCIQDLFCDIFHWETQLEWAAHTGNSLQQIIDVAEPRFQSPLLIWDATFNIQAYSRNCTFSNEFLSTILEQRFFTSDVVKKIISKGQLATPEYQRKLRIIQKEDTFSGFPYYVYHYFHNGHRTYSAALAASNGIPSQGELDILLIFLRSWGYIWTTRLRKIITTSIFMKYFSRIYWMGKSPQSRKSPNGPMPLASHFRESIFFTTLSLNTFHTHRQSSLFTVCARHFLWNGSLYAVSTSVC